MLVFKGGGGEGGNFYRFCFICKPVTGFLSGFGGGGGKTAICNLMGGGIALSTCTALDNVAESGGILNPPPPPPPPNLNPSFSEHLV